MRFDINRDMRKKIVVYSVSLAAGILLFTVINHFDQVLEILQRAMSILGPFLFGAALAFVLNSPMMWFEKQFSERFQLKPGTCRGLAVAAVFLLFIAFLAILIMTVVPNLIESIRQFVNNVSGYSDTLRKYGETLFAGMNLSQEFVESMLNSLDILPSLSDALQSSLPKLATLSMDVVRALMNSFIALAAGVYILMDKDHLIYGFKKLSYSIFNWGTAEYLTVLSRDAKEVFELYIVGNLSDSLVVGIVCYVCMLILQIPYAPMIGFVVGVTNIIPVFGPFLGAVPVIIILVLIKPVYALIFAVFILILQQIDGNVLKPIILGDRLGLSGFWILFSVTVGGALFGIVGMFLGVPVFALIYAGLRDLANMRLKEKNIDFDKEAGLKH
jgi:predicted PurR-regulated permease PerM